MLTFALTVRFFLALTLAADAVPRLASMKTFSRAVRSYAIVPQRLTRPAAWILTITELGLAAFLLIGTQSRPAAIASAGLLLAYSIAMAITIARGRAIGCGCGGLTRQSQVGYATLARNAVLLTLACSVAIEDPPSIEMLRLNASDIGELAGVAAVAFALVRVGSEVAYLASVTERLARGIASLSH